MKYELNNKQVDMIIECVMSQMGFIDFKMPYFSFNELTSVLDSLGVVVEYDKDADDYCEYEDDIEDDEEM